MGITMQQLTDTMTAQEFAQHHALELHEPMPQVQQTALGMLLAALANGPLQPPAQGRLWAAHDFSPELWQDISAAIDDEPAVKELTVDDIMASARMAGMVQ